MPKAETPDFNVPDPFVDGISVVTFREDTEQVQMPLWYWKKIVRYIADTQIWYMQQDYTTKEEIK